MIPFDAALCLFLAAFALVTALVRAGCRVSAERAGPRPAGVASVEHVAAHA
jgi:hypothetical protein